MEGDAPPSPGSIRSEESEGWTDGESESWPQKGTKGSVAVAGGALRL